MNYEQYRNLSFDELVVLAKGMVLIHIEEVLDSYSYNKAPQSVLKEEMRSESPRFRSDLDGLCDNETRRILIDQASNGGYEQLRNLIHEMFEAMLGDRDSFNVIEAKKGVMYKLPHSRIEKVTEDILESLKQTSFLKEKVNTTSDESKTGDYIGSRPGEEASASDV